VLKIGLTGIPGSGKTTVMKMFARLGAKVISTDEICHRLLYPSHHCYHQIVSAFGQACLRPDGNLDRVYLRQRLLSSFEDKKKLEAILHPAIYKTVITQLKEYEKEDPKGIVIIEVPLLFEAGWQELFDLILTVYAGEDICLARLKERGLTEEEAQGLISLQWSIEKKVRQSDFVIKNETSLEETEKQVRAIWDNLLAQLHR